MTQPIRIKLTPEQREVFWRANKEIAMIPKILSKLIKELTEESVEKEDALWQSVFELTGTTSETHNHKIDWVNNTVTATPRTDLETE